MVAARKRGRDRVSNERERMSQHFRSVGCKKLNGADGISDIQGKATRIRASERGERTSFNPLALTAEASPLVAVGRVACDLLFCRWRFTATDDFRQATQRTVYCFSIRKDFRYVRFQYDNVTSPRIVSRVFSADTF